MNDESKTQFQCALEFMKEALDVVPLNEKRAFAEAVQKVPELVELESSPERYLRFDSFDPWAASRRIVAYWNVRLDFFGDRAFLPMTCNGEGALSKTDIELLKTGFLMLLPHDKHGRAVVFHDRARLTAPEYLDMATRFRCFFYILSTAAESESCVDNGLVYLTVYSDRTRKITFDFKALLDGISFVKRQVFPFRTVALHLVMLSKRQIMNKVIPMTMQALQRVDFLTESTIVHSGKSVDVVLDELKGHGFDIEGIPKIPCDGLWTFGCFRRWMEKRGREESRRLAAGTMTQKSSVTTGNDAKRQDSSDEDRRRKRETDAMYARRKRARGKIEQNVLQEEVKRLTHQQECLKKTESLLQDLIRQALKIVEGNDTPPQHFAVSTTSQMAPQDIQIQPAGASFPTSHFQDESANQSASISQVLQSQDVVPPANLYAQAYAERERQQRQQELRVPMLASLLQRGEPGSIPHSSAATTCSSTVFQQHRPPSCQEQQQRPSAIHLPILPLQAPYPGGSLPSSTSVLPPTLSSLVPEAIAAASPSSLPAQHPPTQEEQQQQQQLFQQLFELLSCISTQQPPSWNPPLS